MFKNYWILENVDYTLSFIENWNRGQWLGDKENFYSILHDSPARHNICLSVAGSNKVPLVFCAVMD